jgi:ferredoxin-NADP reductase
MPPPIWHNAIVVKIETAAPNTKIFTLQVPSETHIPFRAGQFVTMDLPISDKRQKRWRSYSIANPPDGSNQLEFCIVRLEGGAGTRYFFEEVVVGTEIKFKNPDGNFVLPEKITSDLVFICTGTGVAPFRSMIFDLIQQKKMYQNLHLIFGTRYEESILYRKEFEALAAENPQFRYDVALSKAENPLFHKGHVHQIYLNTYKTPRADVQFYLCGWSNMIDEAVANLLVELKYDKSQVHYELYG